MDSTRTLLSLSSRSGALAGVLLFAVGCGSASANALGNKQNKDSGAGDHANEALPARDGSPPRDAGDAANDSRTPPEDAPSDAPNDTTSDAPSDAPTGELCDENTFVYVNASAHNVLVTGNFTTPQWAGTQAQGALKLNEVSPGIFMRQVTFPTRDRYLYKFIVDGSSNWVADPNNPESVPDGTGKGMNSVVDRYRTFVYSAASTTSVSVTGDFTSPAWSAASSDALSKDSSFAKPTFVGAIELPTGTSLYKFIVNGSSLWSPDPLNPESQPDGQGGENSVAHVCHE